MLDNTQLLPASKTLHNRSASTTKNANGNPRRNLHIMSGQFSNADTEIYVCGEKKTPLNKGKSESQPTSIFKKRNMSYSNQAQKLTAQIQQRKGSTVVKKSNGKLKTSGQKIAVEAIITKQPKVRAKSPKTDHQDSKRDDATDRYSTSVMPEITKI